MKTQTHISSDIITEDYISPEEYFLMEEQVEYKNEYEEGKIINMSGTTLNHNIICSNLYGIGYEKLKGKPCKILPSELKIEVAKDKFYYPDASIVCNNPRLVWNRSDIIDNPTVIFEVSSPSTRSRDRNTKMKAYLKLPSLKEYVLIEQEVPFVEVYTYVEPNKWIYRFFDELDLEIAFESVNITISMKELYDRVIE